MYARVTTLQWQIGKKVEAMDEAIQIVKESIVPVSKQQPGFKGFLTLLDRKGGKVILLTCPNFMSRRPIEKSMN